MRILLVTQYFYPEKYLVSNDFMFELARRDISVDALAGIPNYPGGKYFKGYGLFRQAA